MRTFVINNSLNIITKYNSNLSKEDMEKIEYGLTGLYILITKTVIIFFIAYLLGILLELIIFMIIYNLLRTVSFGIHASKSHICLISSTIIFLSAVYLSKYFILPMWFKFLFGLLGTIYIYKYSPADTEKRPIVDPKRRKIYKILSTLVATLMTFISLVVSFNFIANSCILSILIQCVMVSPITYKLTNQQYDNYKNYQFD